ncbi:MAG: hypothetical protein Q4D58_09865 [Synergistaceae bacterium]|nr:hypothetical protein [Synergistaceae bacterium]
MKRYLVTEKQLDEMKRVIDELSLLSEKAAKAIAGQYRLPEKGTGTDKLTQEAIRNLINLTMRTMDWGPTDLKWLVEDIEAAAFVAPDDGEGK